MFISRFEKNLLAFSLSFLTIIVVSGLIVEHHFQKAITTHLASGNFALVEKILSDKEGRAFCEGLNWRMEVRAQLAREHNAIARLYNAAALRQPSINRPLLVPMLEEHRTVSSEAINGLIFIAHINPWQECASRYKIFHYPFR